MPNRTNICIEEALRGIYIDFEGTAVDPPSFLGATWLHGDTKISFNTFLRKRSGLLLEQKQYGANKLGGMI